MLRQANDQLERTMNERQELEDSVKEANEETTAKVKLISLMDLVKNKSVDRLTWMGSHANWSISELYSEETAVMLHLYNISSHQQDTSYVLSIPKAAH